jgi:hypothetical protein
MIRLSLCMERSYVCVAGIAPFNCRRFRRTATISFVMSVRLSVCLSVRIEQLGFNWTDFYEISYLRIFRKSVEKIQASFKSDNKNGYITEDIITFMLISRWILLKWEMFQVIVNKIKINILCSITFFRKPFRLWDNMGKYGRAGQVTDDIMRMRIACWIRKATNTHTLGVCNTYCLKFLQGRAVLLRYMYIACCACNQFIS